MHPDALRVRELLHYDLATGVFTRKVRLAQRHHVGDRADFAINAGPMTGYRRVAFDSRRELAHRVAWLYVHGEWPVNEIDHWDGDHGNNAIANLRDVPRGINSENMRKARKDNASGFLGVHLHRETGKWRARVQVRGKIVEAGLHFTPEEAHAAYVAVKRKYHEGCTI